MKLHRGKRKQLLELGEYHRALMPTFTNGEFEVSCLEKQRILSCSLRFGKEWSRELDSEWRKAGLGFLNGISKIKKERAWTNSELEEVLKLISETLMEAARLPDLLPRTTYKFHAALKQVGLGGEFSNRRVTVCRCEKTIYYGCAENETYCRECGCDREEGVQFFYHSVRERYETWYRDRRIRKLFTEWTISADPDTRDPNSLSDFYDGALFKEEVWPIVKDDPHVAVWELHIDGVMTKRHGKNNTTTVATLVDLRLPPHIRYRKEFLIPTVIMGKFHGISPSLRLLPLVADLCDAIAGRWVFVTDERKNISVTTAILALIVVDSKAAPYVNCQSVAPATKGACTRCKVEGERISNPFGQGGRMCYPCVSTGDERDEWSVYDNLNEGLKGRHEEHKNKKDILFHDVSPLLIFLGVSNKRIMYCPPHNDSNVIVDLFSMVANHGHRRYTPDVRVHDLQDMPWLTPVPRRGRDGKIITKRTADGRMTQVKEYPKPPWAASREALARVESLFADENMRCMMVFVCRD